MDLDDGGGMLSDAPNTSSALRTAEWLAALDDLQLPPKPLEAPRASTKSKPTHRRWNSDILVPSNRITNAAPSSHPSPAVKPEAVLHPSFYWNKLAVTHLDAQLLVTRVGLRFPLSGGSLHSSVKYPLFRLIATGEDTPDNIRMLLGSHWEVHLGGPYAHWRMEALAYPSPPLGSPLYAERMHLNVGLPRWSPREATVKEQKALEEYQKMNQPAKKNWHKDKKGSKSFG